MNSKWIRRVAAPLMVLALSLFSLTAKAEGYAQTRYPIVLVHGAVGFDSLLGVVDYWYQIPQALRANGAQVFVVKVSSVNSPYVRGEQLLNQVQQIRSLTGAAKVNLIGHSLGAPTARYVAGVRPGIVASVVTVGGSNGVPQLNSLASSLMQQEGSLLTFIGGELQAAVGRIIDFLSGAPYYPQDGQALLAFLSPAGTTAFNTRFPAGLPSTRCGEGPLVASNGVHYMSWSGTATFTNFLDPSDYVLALASLVQNEPSDGLVGRCASHLGQVIRDDYYLNHLDETNLLFGLRSWFSPNPVSLYLQTANRLKTLGL